MQIAAWFLMTIPFAIAYLLVRWVQTPGRDKYDVGRDKYDLGSDPGGAIGDGNGH